jgi:hypothetical protein
MRTEFLWLMLVALGVCAGCEPKHRSEIRGIASLQFKEDGSVVVVGDRAALTLSDSDGAAASRMNVSRGDTFSLSDRRHAAARYTFLGFDGGRAVFEERTWHRPPDGPSEETVTRISVGAY